MSMAEIPPVGYSEALFDPETLVDYIRTQFNSAYQKETAMNLHEEPFANGSFYQQVPIPGADHHEMVRQSIRIVMKPPFSTLVLSQYEEFAELYAVHLQGEDGHVVAGEDGYFADQYLVRQYSNGHYTPFVLVTEDGVHDVDLEDFDIVAGFGALEAAETQTPEEQLEEMFRPIRRAYDLHGLLSRYNIVAIND